VVWEIVFLMLILKIPIVYLCTAAWWAIRAEPAPDVPLEPVRRRVRPGPGPRGRYQPPGRLPRRPRGPHGSPRRTYARPAATVARAGDGR